MTGKELFEKVNTNIGQVVVGREQAVKLMLTALISGGNVLLEDLPGSGKTTLAKAISKSIGCDFNRVQFTPDLLPGDITGIRAYNQATSEFYLKRGPVFTNILLADEINRATPRTQSGLLECMEERQVTIDGEKFVLDAPFMVIATQNPIESSGTYPLPEAQMDRFMMRLSMGQPSVLEEKEILKNHGVSGVSVDDISAVITKDDVADASKCAENVFVHDSVLGYIASIIDATRNDSRLKAGVSTRAGIALLKAVKAYCFLDGREYVTPDDVKVMAMHVLPHRFYMDYTTENAVDLCRAIVANVDVPTEEFSKK